MEMFDEIALLRNEVKTLREALAEFVLTRGRHDGEHSFCCSNNGRCVHCETSYIAAEARLDAALKANLNAAQKVLEGK